MVRTTYEAAGLKIVEEAFAVSGAAQEAEKRMRDDVIVVHVTNTSAEPRVLKPRLVVDTTLPLQFSPGDRQALVNQHESARVSLAMTGIQGKGPRRAIQLASLTVPAGKTAAFAVFYGGGEDAASATLPRALSAQGGRCVLGARAVAVGPRAGARSGHPGVARLFRPQHLAGPRDQEGATVVPSRADLLPRPVDRRRRVSVGGGGHARRRRRGPRRRGL